MSDEPLRDRRALVAVDLGAESCRVSLLRFEDDRLVARLVHRFPNAPRASEDGLRWPLERIERGVIEGLTRCGELAPEGIRSVAIDGWAVDYVRLDTDGHALAEPFCYRDDRLIAAEQWVHTHVPASQLRELSGIQIQRINTAYQLVADRMQGISAAPWLNLPEYLMYRLGGMRAAEGTNASHTQLLKIGEVRWCAELFSSLELDRSLAPPLVTCGTILGRVNGALGSMPAFRDTAIVAPACHDTASAIAGIPLPAGGGDWAYISSGTWSLIGTILPAPENGERARASNYTNLRAAGGGTLFHKGLNGMWLLRQCVEHWAHEHDVTLDVADLAAAAAALPAPAQLLVVDDPELMSHGRMPQRIAQQLERSGGDALPLTPDAAPLYASLIFHSLASHYATVLREIAEITGRTFERIYTVGGGSRNIFLNRLIEEKTGIPVRRGPAESSTLGNFAVQLAALESDSVNPETIAHWACVLSDCSGMDGL